MTGADQSTKPTRIATGSCFLAHAGWIWSANPIVVFFYSMLASPTSLCTLEEMCPEQGNAVAAAITLPAVLPALQDHVLFMEGTMNINGTLLRLCLFY